MNEQRLYDYLMESIEPIIYHGINEAYDNMILEKYDFRDFVDRALDLSRKAIGKVRDARLDQKTRLACGIIKRFASLSLKRISETKGARAANDFVTKSENEVKRELQRQTRMSPKMIMRVFYISAATILGASAAGSIYVQSQRDMDIPDKNIETVAPAMDIEDVDFTALDGTFDAEGNINYVPIRPSDYYKENGATMSPSQKCIQYIKRKEVLCLYPYFSTVSEWNAGKLTIGYGHVICEYRSDGTLAWHFPEGISAERRREIKNTILAYKRNGWIRKSNCGTVNGTVQNMARHPNVRDVITREEAELFFEKDMEIANDRVLRVLGLKRCGNGNYDMAGKLKPNVAEYCYYNQNIYDMLMSATFNMGVIRNSTEFSRSLAKCKFDMDENRIDMEDFAVTFANFKKIGKGSKDMPNNRRVDEYKEFGLGDTENVNTDFNDYVS